MHFYTSSYVRVCSVGEPSGMECNGSIPLEWVGSILVFSFTKKIEMEWFPPVFSWRQICGME
jgi:hypothetical protein